MSESTRDPSDVSVKELADGSSALLGKRATELKKIEALKLRLKNLRAEQSLSESDSTEAVEAVRQKCENLLNLTKRISDGIHSKLQAEKEEMELYRDAAVLLLSGGSLPAQTASQLHELEKGDNGSQAETTDEKMAVVNLQQEQIKQLEEEVKERDAEIAVLKKRNEEISASLREIAEEAAENAEALVNLQMAELTRISSEEYHTVEDLKLALEKERAMTGVERQKVAELNEQLNSMKVSLAEAKEKQEEAQDAAREAAAAVAMSGADESEYTDLGTMGVGAKTSIVLTPPAENREGMRTVVGEGGLLQVAQHASSSSVTSMSSDSGLDENERPEAMMARHYLNKLKLLEATFETDELLAKALYKDLGAESIDKPQRVGFLTKQGGAVKSWKRRYFILKDNFLFYYKRVKDDAPIGVIQLEAGCAEEAAPGEIDKKNCFKLKTKNRVWWLHAERQIEMDIWIECIKGLASWYDNAQLRQPTVVKLRGSGSSSSGGPMRAAKKASMSFRLSTYLVTPSPR